MKAQSNVIYVITLFICVALYSCQGEKNRKSPEQSKEYTLISFCENLRSVIHEEKISYLETNELDSAGNTIEIIRDEVEQEYLKVQPSEELITFLGSEIEHLGYLVRDNFRNRIIFLSIGFHLYCNNKNIGREEIKKEFFKILQHKLEMVNREIDNEKIKNARINDSIFHQGDTVEIPLLISTTVERKLDTRYSGGIMPDEFYEDTVNVLRVVGVIIEKGFGEIDYPTPRIDSSDIIFRLKILELSRDDVLVTSQKIGIGDSLNFYVTSYGRPIEHYRR